MIPKINSEFVIFDIGERYIKAMLVRHNWDGSVDYIYSTRNFSKGIENGHITSLRSLSDALFQIIYRIEIDVGTVVKSVIILFSFTEINIKNFKTSININNIVKQNHLQNIDYQLSIGLDQSILGYLSKEYQLDNLKKIANPLHMCGSLLTFNCSFISVDSVIIRNLITSFNRNEIEANYIGYGLLLESSAITDLNFIIVDVGYSSTRVLIKSEDESYILQFKIGFKNLIEILCKGQPENIDKMEKNIHISYGETPKETVDLCRKFFKNLFYLILSDLHKYNILYKVGVNIYLSGGITTIPLIDIFLEQSFDRNFIIHDVIQKFSSIYNRNIFSNLIATSEYISKKREFDLLLKIASSG